MLVALLDENLFMVSDVYNVNCGKQMRALVYASTAAFLIAFSTPLAVGQLRWLTSGSEHFEPSHRLEGVGVDRENISDLTLARRSELMIESQTFSILRDPQALSGAERINSPKLQSLFNSAASSSGLPASFIAAIAYLESWGNPRAESPAGPKGIMQIAAGTAPAMGLKIVYAKKYRIVTERRQVKSKKGKVSTRMVKRRIPYTVLVRDERMLPERAVPAAARYLAGMENRYGGRDWATWAYHCGEGCARQVMAIVKESSRMSDDASVARAFFGAHPAFNKDLYRANLYHMERDYSPTYFFRIRRAEQLLELHRTNPAAFKKLFEEYRNRVNPDQRAPHRLSVWLKQDDLAYQNCEDIKRDQGKRLVKVFDDPKYFGFTLKRSGPGAIGERDLANQEYYMHASPSVVGTIAYIAYETRRLHNAMKPRGERFEPIEVTALVQPLDYEQRLLGGTKKNEINAHCTGLVFDISTANLPPGQREALEFILNDLGWSGYLGFVKESSHSDALHIGAAPSARDFFSKVFEDALSKKSS